MKGMERVIVYESEYEWRVVYESEYERMVEYEGNGDNDSVWTELVNKTTYIVI